MYDLLITAAAEADLDCIVEYMAVKLANPSAASNFLDRVEACYQVLQTTPLAYALCSDDVLQAKQYRRAVINNFLLVFRIEDKHKTVHVLRFFYGRQDYVRQF